MKTRILSIMLLAMGISSFANAGVGAGGGGTSVVCRDTNGHITEATLLDLYEAQTVYGLNLRNSTGDLGRDYFLAAAATYTLQGYPQAADQEKEFIAYQTQLFFESSHMTAPGQKLALLGDTGPVPELPEGCQLEQVAIFHDSSATVSESIDIDSEIWQAMDTLNQSALMSHEAFYKNERILHESTSETTRAFVAHIYAANGVTPTRAGIPDTAVVYESEDPRFRVVKPAGPDATSTSNDILSKFYVYPITTAAGAGVRLQFDSIAGRVNITKTTADVSGIAFQVKRSFIGNEMMCVVTEANKNVDVELPFAGNLRHDWSMELVYKTGAPVKLIMKKSGVPMSEEFLNQCP